MRLENVYWIEMSRKKDKQDHLFCPVRGEEKGGNCRQADIDDIQENILISE